MSNREAQKRAQGKRLARVLPGRPVMRIVLIRVAPRKLDSDNLAAEMDAYRGGVADALRIDDASPLVEWCYEQRKGESEVLVEWCYL
jgi:hypothetical protein